MKKTFISLATLVLASLFSVSALAKLPALSDEAKAKAAEAAAKTAHGNKVADFQLCKSREKVAAHYYKTAKSSSKQTTPPVATPPCADPGPFVAAAPAAPAAVAAAPAAGAKPAAPATAPAAAPAAPAKKS
jgi:phage protein D